MISFHEVSNAALLVAKAVALYSMARYATLPRKDTTGYMPDEAIRELRRKLNDFDSSPPGESPRFPFHMYF